MDLPRTLHGQLYLLAYDRYRHRFDLDKLWLLGFALRAAMLTDLFLTGHLKDAEGTACRASCARPGDPVLRAVFDTIDINGPQTWSWLIGANQEHAARHVHDQLMGHGWLCMQRRWVLGIVPTSHLGLYDENLVGGLAVQVVEALRNATAGRSAAPRPLTLGLLSVLGEMPTVLDADERAGLRPGLKDLALAAGAPVAGLHAVVESIYEVMHGKVSRDGGGGYAGWAACGGGCGAGCGGGCGGG